MNLARNLFSLATLLAFMLVAAPPTFAADNMARMAELERVIKAQQAQLAAQAKILEKMQKEIGSLAKSDGGKGFVTTGLAKSGNDKVGLKIYGQVNRGVLLVDDGHNAKAFSVDNDSSSTRIGLVGNVEATDDLTIGTKIEVQFESNSTGNVNQANNSSTIASNSFTERHLDLFFAHKQIGTLWLGQGSTASDAMASTDLSGTTLVGYSSVSDIAGGISFATSGTGAITGNPAVGDVFSDMTGLGRDDRVRYDTPDMAGFQLGTSLVDGGEWDLAGSYNREFESLQLSVGGGYSNPSGTSTTTSSITHGSLSMMMKNGFNATVAAGKSKMKSAARNDPGFQYLKLGYMASWTKLGKTAFAVDYGQYDDVAQNSDEADAWALMLVQNFTDWGTEVYGVYRNYGLKRSGSNLDDIDAVLMGARVKF
ncbi:MAG: porin [Alphaproteobacteria bacterium]|mgnify:CR=1 FL=1|jgi:hypothetical protein|nr:porin [Alphaproteobacteria bacterium]MBT4016994.1 porin [Alphaproteobacteria bacterium]